MPKNVCGDPSETFTRYAAGLARKERLSPDAAKDGGGLRAQLIQGLLEQGVRGRVSRRTFTTSGKIPPGCRSCLRGRGSNLCLTTLCNKNCFFCFNPKPRKKGMSVHGRPAETAEQAVEILKEADVVSVGLSGGEPLLDPSATLETARAIKAKMGAKMRLDLYTNGDLLTPALAQAIKEAGINGLRINLAARDYDPAPVRLALGAGLPAEVEIPAVPEHEARVKLLMEELDEMGAPHLILHELFASAQNLDSLKEKGLKGKDDQDDPKNLTWATVAGSEETAYRLMAYAQGRGFRLSVYYCSCGTQEWIAENALRRRRYQQKGG